MSRRLIINGGRQRRELVLVGRMIVGRDPACDVSESDPLLSRRHAEFVAGARDVIVRDLGSRNGILVNGVKKPQAVLHGGDVVQVGHLQVRYEEEPGPHLDRTIAGADAAAMPTVLAASSAPAPPSRSVVEEPTRAGAPPPSRIGPGTERLPNADALDYEPTVKLTPTPMPAPAAPAGWSAEPMEVFFGPGNRICFEKPARGWRVVPGGTAAIVSLTHESGEAAVVIERASPGPAFAPGEVAPTLAEDEADAILAHDPEASGIDATIASVGERRVVVLTYARTGVAGAERVRQYSIPAGSGLYRLTCSAHASRFMHYDAIFAHIAATFATGS